MKYNQCYYKIIKVKDLVNGKEVPHFVGVRVDIYKNKRRFIAKDVLLTKHYKTVKGVSNYMINKLHINEELRDFYSMVPSSQSILSSDRPIKGGVFNGMQGLITCPKVTAFLEQCKKAKECSK